MADLETQFRKFFLTHPTLSQTFGESFHWDRLPDTPRYPCVRATVVKNATLHSHSKTGEAGMADLQLDVFDDNGIRCNSATEDIRTSLDEYTGSIGEYTHCVILISNVFSLPEPLSRSFRKIIEMKVNYA